MGRRPQRLREKPLKNVLHGYSLSQSPLFNLSNRLFQYLERSILLPFYAAKPIERPIFIIGPFRSGTTILEKIVAEHPQIANFMYITNVWYLAPVTGYLAIKLLLALGVLDRDSMRAVHNPRINYMILSPYECEWVWSQSVRGLWDDDCTDVTAGGDFSDPKFERYLRSMFQRHMLIQRASRFLSKNPVNCLRIGFLHKLFPDARFVTIVRNPLDTVLSHYRAALRMEEIFHSDPETKHMLQDRLHMDLLSMVIKTPNYARSKELNFEHRLLGIANQWNDMQSAVMKNLAEIEGLKEQLLSLRYEELMAAPRQTLNQIWDFVGLNDEHANRISLHYAERLTAPEPVSLSQADRKVLPKVKEILASTADELGYNLGD
jgi:hypothetical protein